MRILHKRLDSSAPLVHRRSGHTPFVDELAGSQVRVGVHSPTGTDRRGSAREIEGREGHLVRIVPGRSGRVEHVLVQHDQARDQGVARRVDDLGTRVWRTQLSCRADTGDATVLDEHRHVVPRGRARVNCDQTA